MDWIPKVIAWANALPGALKVVVTAIAVALCGLVIWTIWRPPQSATPAPGGWPDVQTLESLTKKLRDETAPNKHILMLALKAGDNGEYVFNVTDSMTMDRGEVVYRGKELERVKLLEVRTLTDINYRIHEDVWRVVGANGAQLLEKLLR
jgi:hypothetical protein